MTFRTILTIWAMIVTSLAVASAVTLTMVVQDQPLHRAYACQFAKDYRQEWNLPPAPCQYPAVCHFDGGGVSAIGSVTRTSDGRSWLCTDDGRLVPWTGHLPAAP